MSTASSLNSDDSEPLTSAEKNPHAAEHRSPGDSYEGEHPIEDAVLVSDTSVSRDNETTLTYPEYAKAFHSATLFVAIVVAPVLFGAVHPENRLVLQALFLIGFVIACLQRRAVSAMNSNDTISPTLAVLLSVLAFLAIVPLLQNAALSLMRYEHPILLETGMHLPWPVFFSNYGAYFVWFALFGLTFTYASAAERHRRRITAFLVASSLVCTAIAISHWFYDNGMLFWVFAPEFLTVSDRARWPFVNPNHLGHFLLPLFFVLIAEAETSGKVLTEMVHGAKRRDLARLLSSQNTQRQIALFLSLIVLLGAVSIAILATLSRSSWIALVSCSLGYLILRQLFLKASLVASDDTHPNVTQRRSMESKRIRKSGRVRKKRGQSIDLSRLRRGAGYGLYLLVFAFAFLLLSGRGSELIYDRLDYAVAHSLADIRLTMYQYSLGLFADNAWLGVGFGQWESAFFTVMPATLADLNPVYLHNDPLQLLIELGVIGTAPFVVCYILLLRWSWRCLTAVRLRIQERGVSERALRHLHRFIALLVGLHALFVASFFDFPFRIPAIAYLSAICLGLLLCYGRELERLREPQH